MKPIDSKSNKTLTELPSLIIKSLHEFLSEEDFDRAKQETIPDSSRERILVPQLMFYMFLLVPLFESFSKLAQYITSTANKSVSEAIQEAGVFTKSAFCQARQAFPIEYLRWLWNRLLENTQESFEEKLTYKGHILLGVDSTTVPFPKTPELMDEFDGPTNQNNDEPSCPQGRLLGVVSLLTGYCVDFVLGGYRDSEKGLFVSMLKQLREWFQENKALLLLDRGFFGHNNILDMMDNSVCFILRVPPNYGKVIETLEVYGPGDRLVRMRTSVGARRRDSDAPKTFVIRLITFQVPGFRPITVMTNLPAETFCTQEVAGLYHWRWRIEVFNDEIKNVLAISDLRSKSPDLIRKEILGQLILNNIVRRIMIEALAEKEEAVIRYSFEKSLQSIKDHLETVLVHLVDPMKTPQQKQQTIQRLYRCLLEEIQDHHVKRRPGRHHKNNPPREKYMTPVREDVCFIEEAKEEDFDPLDLAYMYKKAG